MTSCNTKAPALKGDERKTPALKGDERETPALKGDEREAPALKGDKREAPALKGDKREAPTLKGDKREAPALKGDEREAPALKGDKREAPALKGDKREAPALKGDKREAPALKGDKREAPALKGDKKKTITTPHGMAKVEKIMALPGFPSGSSLEFYNERLYLTGDDATKLLILDVDYNVVDSIVLFTNTAARIPKKDKADLESSTVVSVDGKDHLLLVGSASLANREKILLLPLQDSLPTAIIDISIKKFCEKLMPLGLKQVNIEGAAKIKNTLLLANRGNLTDPENHLILTGTNFWLDQEKAEGHLVKILFPATGHFAGISCLAYVAAEDLLFFAASTELTNNSFEDGAIGKSYIGWIKNASEKLQELEVKSDGFIDLVQADTVFKNEKIESLCITKSEGKKFTLHLVSDNDNGVSKLFKMSLTIE